MNVHQVLEKHMVVTIKVFDCSRYINLWKGSGNGYPITAVLAKNF